METYLRKWERENLNQLARLRTIMREAGERLWRLIARILNLTLFMLYMGATTAWQMSFALLRAPRLVRQVGPNERPLERHEFEQRDLPLRWR